MQNQIGGKFFACELRRAGQNILPLNILCALNELCPLTFCLNRYRHRIPEFSAQSRGGSGGLGEGNGSVL